MTKKKAKEEKKRNALILVFIILLAMLVLFYDESWPTRFNEYFEEEPKPEPANIELYRFSDLYSNTTINVELWLINLGETTATNITVYVRARNDTGKTLFNKTIILTTLILKNNETNSGCYSFPYIGSKTVYHTIELSWGNKRESYLKETIIEH